LTKNRPIRTWMTLSGGRRIEELEDRTTPASYNWDGAGNLAVSLGTNESLSFANTGSGYQLTLSGGADTWTAAGTAADGGVAGDVLTFDTTADLAGSIAINNSGAGTGTNDVDFTGAISSGSIIVNTAGSITNDGALSATGAGAISLTAGQNIVVNAGITGGSGGTTLLAQGMAAEDTTGVTIENGAVVTAAGAGAVSVTGTGGAGPNGNDVGVEVTGAGSTITAGGGGTVTVSGTGGGSGNGGHGVVVTDSGEITSDGGAVSITGSGASGTGVFNLGVLVDGGTVTSGGDGKVSIIGFGGSGHDSGAVYVTDSGKVSSGGAGAVSVTGTDHAGAEGACNGVGVSFSGIITSGGGSISVAGIGNDVNEGITVFGTGSIVSGNNAPITITADTLIIDNVSLIDAGTGILSIMPLNSGTLIALGGPEELPGNPLTLGLSAAEIARFTAGTLNIGNASSGEMDISAAIGFSSPVVNLTTGSNIAFTGSGSLASTDGAIALTSGGTGAITSTTGATDLSVAAGTISLHTTAGTIGASGNPIIVSGANLNANSGDGNQYLAAVGSIAIDGGGLNAGLGTVELDGGAFSLDRDNPIDNAASLIVNGATLAMGAFSQTMAGMELDAGSITGTTGMLTSTSRFQLESGEVSAILAGGNGLLKTTNGTVTLSGANRYDGATTVDGGTLLVNGDDTLATGDVAVNANATLGGSGTLGGSVAINTGGGITGGTLGSVGTLTVGGLSFNGGMFRADFNGSASDTLATTGAINLNDGAAGNFAINSQAGSAPASTVFTLIDNTGSGTITHPPLAGAPEGGAATIDSVVGFYTYAGGNGRSFTFAAALTKLVGVPPFAVGSDAGGTSTLTVYNPDGSVAASLDPFPGFLGGIRTAVADFNGDGTPDVVAGTGPGTTAEVKILDGKTGAVLFDVKPFDTFQGGVFVAAGDIDGDGKAELVITPDQSGGPRVEVYSGGTFQETANFFGIGDPGFRGGARAALGDINGDGHADLVVSAGFGGGPRISVYDGAALAQGQTTVHMVGDFFAFSDQLRNGAYVAVGDVTGDGHADLIFGAGPGGGPQVLIVNGESLLTQGVVAAVNAPVASYFAGDPNNRGGIRVAVKNLDGDRFADVVAGAGQSGGSGIASYLGKNLTTGNTAEDFGFSALPGFSGGVFVG